MLEFWMPGRVVPKARPRVAAGVAYLPANYRKWRRTTELELLNQMKKLDAKFPIRRASVHVLLVRHARGDADNILGSCLDACVSVGILLSDRLACVPEISLKSSASIDLSVGALVRIVPMPQPEVKPKCKKVSKRDALRQEEAKGATAQYLETQSDEGR